MFTCEPQIPDARVIDILPRMFLLHSCFHCSEQSLNRLTSKNIFVSRILCDSEIFFKTTVPRCYLLLEGVPWASPSYMHSSKAIAGVSVSVIFGS